MGRIAFLTDRPPAEALPSLPSLGLDVKTERLLPEALDHLADLGPSAVIVDAEHHPQRAFAILSILARRADVPSVALVAPDGLERHPWHEVADEVLLPAATAAEVRVRLALLHRRTGGAGEAVVKLGPLSMNTDTFQVLVDGRTLDLTYKEFELLRFLIQHADRVFTRGTLLLEVWGYNFYGGTRTVDVHVRRLRAKLGPEHEGLIRTIRGVGYLAARPDDHDAAPGWPETAPEAGERSSRLDTRAADT